MKFLLLVLCGLFSLILAALPTNLGPFPSNSIAIYNSGSTNALGYLIVVPRNGHGYYKLGSGNRVNVVFPASIRNPLFKTVQRSKLKHDGAASCIKSVSFGFSEYIIYTTQKGAVRTSLDLTCTPSKQARQTETNALLQKASNIFQFLNISTMRLAPIPLKGPI